MPDNNNTLTPKEWEQEYDKEFLGCNYEGCQGIFCSRHQFKEEVAGKIPVKTKEFIRKVLSQQKQELVEMIRKYEKEIEELVSEGKLQNSAYARSVTISHIINLLENNTIK